MKIIRVGVVFLVLLVPNLSTSDHQKEVQKYGLMPSQISEYYDDYNFVSSFSSEAERAELIGFLTSKEPPAKLKGERLQKIFQVMKKIRSKVFINDPKMVIWTQPQLKHIFLSNIIQVMDIHITGEEASLKVVIYGLKPETNSWFIAQYEQQNGDEKELPSQEKRIEIAKSPYLQRSEIHKWIFGDGEWKKKDENIVFLK